MKKHFSLLAAMLLIACLCMASGGCTNVISKINDKINPLSSITLYSANGEIIRTWKGRLKSVEGGALVKFETDEGKIVSISGTIVIEEAK